MRHERHHHSHQGTQEHPQVQARYAQARGHQRNHRGRTLRGQQSPIIIAVTNKELRDKISRDNCTIGGWQEGFDPFYGAPVILAVLAPEEWPNRVYDGSLVIGNMMLAAHSLGLGSIWIHRAKEEFERDDYRKLLADLGVEGSYEGIGHCAIGYIDGNIPPAHDIKPGRVFWAE